MKYLSVAQMRAADKRCISELGIPGAVLMNNAGAAVFREVSEGPVGIVCGKGNNGGDGYVVARLSLLAGFDPRVVVLANRDEISGDAAIFLKVFERLGGKATFANTDERARDAVSGLRDCAVLVDAIFGTGVSGTVRGPGAAAIHAWPAVRTISVDIPSGINGDTGEVCGAAITADLTVTLHAAKRGHQNEATRKHWGKLIVADIGIPQVCDNDEQWNALAPDTV